MSRFASLFEEEPEVRTNKSKLSTPANACSTARVKSIPKPTEKETPAVVQYKDLLKRSMKEDPVEEDPDLVQLENGWKLFKKNEAGKRIMKQNKPLCAKPLCAKPLCAKPLLKPKSEDKSYREMFDSMVETHHKRTNEFIELNGYDVWYDMYKGGEEETYETEEETEEEDEEEEEESDGTDV